jgi:hypothetical protein
VPLTAESDVSTVFGHVTVSIADLTGQHPVGLEWFLEYAFISSFQKGGSTAQPFPVDQISINTGRISVDVV